MEEEKKKPEEEKQEQSKPEEQAKVEELKAEEKAGVSEQPKEEPKAEETEQKETPSEVEPPKLSAEDELKAENFRLKTQLEAMKVGFNPDCIEDAVVLAENIVKRDGSDIATALQSVAKKYPDWKTDSKDNKGSKVGFKIGADRNADEGKATEDRLNEAFGIKKRKD